MDVARATPSLDEETKRTIAHRSAASAHRATVDAGLVPGGTTPWPGATAARNGNRLSGTELEVLLVDRFTKGLAGLEGRHPARGDGDGLPGARVSAFAGRAALGGKFTEPGDAHRLISCKSVGDGQEHGVDREGGVGPGQ